jgi:hypothetical protein
MRTYLIERVSEGVAVEQWTVGCRTKGAAQKDARDRCARLTGRQARSSFIRLLGVVDGPRRVEPICAFRKHPTSGRVTRI